MIVLHRVLIILSIALYCTPFIAMELPENENRAGLLLCAREFTRGLMSESFGSMYEVNFTHKVLAGVMHTWGKKKLKSKMQASQARAALLALSAPAHIGISNFYSIDSGEPNRTFYNAQALLLRKPIKYAFGLYKPNKRTYDLEPNLYSFKLPRFLSFLSPEAILHNAAQEQEYVPRLNIKRSFLCYWFGYGIGQYFVKPWIKEFFDWNTKHLQRAGSWLYHSTRAALIRS